MYDLKACVVCLSTGVKLYSMHTDQLRQEYKLVSGLQSNIGNGMPNYLCVECSAHVKRFKKFRDKCQRAHYVLQIILERNKEIKESDLRNLDCKHLGLGPSLSFINPNTNSSYEETKFKWNKFNRSGIKSEKIPTVHYSTFVDYESFENTNIDGEIKDRYIKQDVENVNVQSLDEGNITVEVPSTSIIEINKTIEVSLTLESEPSNVDLGESFIDNGNDSDCNNVQENESLTELPYKHTTETIDGSSLDQEYATLVPINFKEAKAAIEVCNSIIHSHRKYRCNVCQRGYLSQTRLDIHSRMHDKHISGSYHCELCNYYYKTDFLLKIHMTDKHMYKYLCKQCPEVTFDRPSAKHHFIVTHIKKGDRKNVDWYNETTRPKWLSASGGKRTKGVSLKPIKKSRKLPADFLVYSPISHEEQYTLVLDRQKSKNYREAHFKCHLCFRGFRELATYNNHMRKHDPIYAGPLQCDMCKLHFKDQRKMYKHMIIAHLCKYSCQMCKFVCYNKGQAQMHYRWHKNVTYQCPHCGKDFKNLSTRLTHIRIKHPSMNICNLCGHSFVSEIGLYYHKKIAHSKEDIQLSDSLTANTMDPLYCADCKIQFVNEAAFTTHLGSSNKHASTNLSSKPVRSRLKSEEPLKRGRRRRHTNTDVHNTGVSTSHNCEVCGVYLSNDVQARKHYEAEHPGTDYLKRYMCDVCGHTTKQYANLIVHMRTHTNEKPYVCHMCDRRFSMPSNRDRHMVVHTGEKRYQCQHCNRRFTQSSAVKLHIQTVHLKIPYAPWDKKNRKRRGKEIEASFVNTVNTTECLQAPPRKIMFESQGDYLNAYINYNDE